MLIRKNVRIVGEQRVQLAKDVTTRYKGGESIRAIALSIGRSYGFVHQLLEEAGAELRARGGDRRPRKTTTAAKTKATK